MDRILKIEAGSSIRSQIVAFYRNRIRSGELAAGAVLPPARLLAAQLGTAEANVHHAFAALVREGLIARRPRAGTVVIAGERPYRVTFYFSSYYTLVGERFTRPLIAGVEAELARHGIECQVIYETGSGEGRTLLEQLAKERSIQGVILRSLAAGEAAQFKRLPVPFVAISGQDGPHGVTFFTECFADQAALALKLSGGRRAGVIYTGKLHRSGGGLKGRLQAAAARHGVELPDELCFDGGCAAASGIDDFDLFAGHALGALLDTVRPPDSVLLLSDNLVPGVTMELYRRKLNVPDQLRIAVHRTVENPIGFPFPCMLVENRIDELAGLLVGRLLDLHAGRPPRAGELSVACREWLPVQR